MLKTCHFCNKVTNQKSFMYAEQQVYKDELSVCSYHFDVLYDMTYIVGNKVSYLARSQRELMAIKRLERDLKIKNRV